MRLRAPPAARGPKLETDMLQYDIAIVGAGPAGASAAYRLARGGARVALLDDSHPREKPCGGGLTGRALRLVQPALGTDAVPSVRIGGASFAHHARTARVTVDDGRGAPALVVASRRAFDEALFRAAVAAGAHHIADRARHVEATSSGWRVLGRATDIDCRWLLGADGATSLVRRRVAQPFARADLSIATGWFVHETTSDQIELAFEDAPAGYLWSFPRPDHVAVGICAQADASTTPQLQAIGRRWMERWLPGPRPVTPYAWPIPSLSEGALAREPYAGRGWMLLGDAAGLVDPITREGIYFALRSADAAAASLLAGRDPAARYLTEIRDDIQNELRRAARAKARFFRPHFMALLLRALEHSAPIRNVMADLISGEQGYRGLRRRLLATLEWGLIKDLYRAPAQPDRQLT
jgi:geranylgeranyl reductase family protein